MGELWTPPPEGYDFSTMNQAAVFDHEMYTSWVNAGFTEDQAMMLLLNMKQMSWESYNKEKENGE